MNRYGLALSAFALLLASAALAQTASLGQRSLTDGLLLAPESAATVDDATAGTLNPAGIGLMHGMQLQYWHDRELVGNSGTGVLGDGVYAAAAITDWLSAGLSMEWLRRDGLPGYTKTHGEIALSPSRAFSLGVGFSGFSSSDTVLGSLTSWDVGLTWRPIKYVSLAASARDFDNPAISGTGYRAPRRFDFAAAFRPFGPRFSLAADYLFMTDGYDSTLEGPGNGLVGVTALVDLPFGVGLLGGLGVPVGANQTTYGQIGLRIATEQVAVTGSYAPSSAGSALDLGLANVGVRLSAESFEGLPLPGGEVIDVDLAEVLAPKRTGLEALVMPETGDPYEQLLGALERAQRSRSGGVILRLGALGGLSLGRVEELRGAIAALRAHHKLVVAYLGGGGDATYYLAAACDRIYAMPLTDFPLHGFATSSLYLAEGLGKLGVRVDVARVGPYKSAPDALTRDEPSPEQTETTQALLHDATSRYQTALTDARGLTPAAIQQVLDRGLSSAEDLQKAGFLDGVLYPDELEKTLGDLLHARVRMIAPDLDPDFHQATWSDVPAVAVVNVFGIITGGESESGGLLAARTAGAETLVRELQAAQRDDTIAAIVVRVDSGGGDGAASELIWRAIHEAKRHKPVVVSFGDVAASGGYYLAAGADEILAEPSTITGSIGVFALKPDLSGLLKKLGIHPHQDALTPNADLFSLTSPWSEGEKGVVQGYIDAFYATFVKRVAEGRKLTADQVEKVGRGRVWSGAAARERGLIDGFGSLQDAIDHAKERAHLAPDDAVRVVTFDERKSTMGLGVLGELLGLAPGEDQVTRLAQTLLRETGAGPALLMPSGQPLALPETLPTYR